MKMIPVVNCIMADMPPKIKGYTAENSDGSFTVVLNSRLTYEQHILTYVHEIMHIKHNDFQKTNTDAIEKAAHF